MSPPRAPHLAPGRACEKADLEEFFYRRQEMGESCNVALQVSTINNTKDYREKREKVWVISKIRTFRISLNKTYSILRRRI